MAKLLKELYDTQYIQILEDTISKHFLEFDGDNFILSIFDESWDSLELKHRMRHISTTLYQYLPNEYEEAIDILKSTFKDMPKFYLENMIFQDFVEVYGLDEANIDISFDALEIFTIESSSEFAIRQFILKYPIKTITKMKKWSKNKNEHIRRLASEGCRPRLPWAIALQLYKNDPSDILPILETLQDDSSEYVRKSVANSLNDISKDNPNITIEIASRWLSSPNLTSQKEKLIKHACRTLLKGGNQEVLKLFGYVQRWDVEVSNFKISPKTKIGESVEFEFKLISNDAHNNLSNHLGNLRIEYMIYYLRPNKKENKYSQKVFKLAEKEYKSKQEIFKKSHSFRKISTRKYYSGKQYLSIIINGEEKLKSKFELIV